MKNPSQARNLSRFFKTGRGEYGEGDIFLGITVPEQRRIAARFTDLSLPEIQELLGSSIHEHRLTALLILVLQYRKAGTAEKERFYLFYIKNARQVNNWDLVDSSAPYIAGDFLRNRRDRSVLDRLAVSRNLWERRIAVVATLAFIREENLKDTFRICRRLLDDPHDLIHKACGWMLREAGKKNQKSLSAFLSRYALRMPRTMLRYAIERLPDRERRHWLAIRPSGRKI